MTDYTDMLLDRLSYELQAEIDADLVADLTRILAIRESVLYGSNDEAGIGEILDIL